MFNPTALFYCLYLLWLCCQSKKLLNINLFIKQYNFTIVLLVWLSASIKFENVLTGRLCVIKTIIPLLEFSPKLDKQIFLNDQLS